jgi:hypothetical protein
MKFSNLLPDLPFPQSLLAKTFQSEHERYREAFPGWSLSATRRKIIASYWLKILLNHFGVLIIAGIFFVILFNKQQFLGNDFLSVIPASIIVFLVLFISMYWPLYQLEFLPHLDSCIESYKGQLLEGIQQCKKQQYSVVTLMLIQHTYQQMAGMEPPLINNDIAQLLAKQYGISVKSIGTALQLVQRGNWDKGSIRKRTETMDDFEDAKEYFEQLNCIRAVMLLDQLQQKILRQAS